MSEYTATHPQSIIRFIPLGATAHTITNYLNDTQQALCADVFSTFAPGTGGCPAYINCVLGQLDEYTKAGLGGGTSLLTLVPAALEVLPRYGLDVGTVLGRRGNAVVKAAGVVLGGFCGVAPIGGGFRALRHAVEDAVRKGRGRSKGMKGEQDIRGGKKCDAELGTSKIRSAKAGRLEDVWAIWQKPFEESRSANMAHGPLVRMLLLFLALAAALTITYSALVIGLLGIVTWACDRQLLTFSWIVARMAPNVLEGLILLLFRAWFRYRIKGGRESIQTEELVENEGSTNKGVYTRLVEEGQELEEGQQGPVGPRRVSGTPIPAGLKLLVHSLEIACKILHGALAVWGTAVLGSTILIDGLPGMAFLMLVPALFGLMQFLTYESMRLED